MTWICFFSRLGIPWDEHQHFHPLGEDFWFTFSHSHRWRVTNASNEEHEVVGIQQKICLYPSTPNLSEYLHLFWPAFVLFHGFNYHPEKTSFFLWVNKNTSELNIVTIQAPNFLAHESEKKTRRSRFFMRDCFCLHPRKLSWIPKMTVWKRWLLWNMVIFWYQFIRFPGV